MIERFIYLIFIFTLIVSCDDKSTGPDQSDITTDFSPPEVSLIIPDSIYVVSTGSDVNIAAEASDDEGLEQVNFFMNDQLLIEDFTSPYEYIWSTDDLLGHFDIYAQAIDINGNETISESVEIKVTFFVVHYPYPENYASGVERNISLTWLCLNPEGRDLVYDVYFGDSSVPPLVSGGQEEMFYQVSNLSYGTTYYWKIVADDGQTTEATRTWYFTTIEAPE